MLWLSELLYSFWSLMWNVEEAWLYITPSVDRCLDRNYRVKGTLAYHLLIDYGLTSSKQVLNSSKQANYKLLISRQNSSAITATTATTILYFIYYHHSCYLVRTTVTVKVTAMSNFMSNIGQSWYY